MYVCIQVFTKFSFLSILVRSLLVVVIIIIHFILTLLLSSSYKTVFFNFIKKSHKKTIKMKKIKLN